MTTKLTLSVERGVVLRAKRYAEKHNKSLSEIVTMYLDSLSADQKDSSEIDLEVLALSDEIPIKSIPRAKGPKYQHLKEKYLHE